MMKFFLFFSYLLLLLSCHPSTNDTRQLQSRIDSLERILKLTYKPGLGEFMSAIQVHHAKLWFAGQNQNWKLADFEMHEIEESLEDIKTYNSDREEVKEIGMIQPPLDSLNKSIQQKSFQSFKSSFILLTNTCNRCHQATAHEFNVIQIPDSPPFSNQSFKSQ